MDRDLSSKSRFTRGEVFLTEAAVEERMRREFLIPADDEVVYGGAIYRGRPRRARQIYGGYLDVARRYAMPLLLTSSTSRCNPERVAALSVRRAQRDQDWMGFFREVRVIRGPVLLGGLLSCATCLSAGRALRTRRPSPFIAPSARSWGRRATSSWRRRFRRSAEARGLAQAMSETGLPFIVSFVVDRTVCFSTGRLSASPCRRSTT